MVMTALETMLVIKIVALVTNTIMITRLFVK